MRRCILFYHPASKAMDHSEDVEFQIRKVRRRCREPFMRLLVRGLLVGWYEGIGFCECW